MFTGRTGAPRLVPRPERPIVHGPRAAATIRDFHLRKDLTMAITMHSASVPIFVRMLGNLVTWLDKAEAHAAAKKFEPAVYLARAPRARHAAAADSRSRSPATPPSSASRGWPASRRRRSTTTRRRSPSCASGSRKTIDYVQSVPAAQIDGSDAKEISVPRRDGAITMNGEAYLKHFVLPNFFFHVTTTYALLRHNGVELGKTDYPRRDAAGGNDRDLIAQGPGALALSRAAAAKNAAARVRRGK